VSHTRYPPARQRLQRSELAVPRSNPAGLSAPKWRTMGHAGAIVSAIGESAAEKVEIMKECGVTVVERPSQFGQVVYRLMPGPD